MKLSQIIETVNGKVLVGCEDDMDVIYGFGSDLMSDALARIHDNCEETILITGLCNAQSIRTADMLDIHTILIVRGKEYNEDDLELAQDCDINIITTDYTMFDTCGLLHAKCLLSV